MSKTQKVMSYFHIKLETNTISVILISFESSPEPAGQDQ